MTGRTSTQPNRAPGIFAAIAAAAGAHCIFFQPATCPSGMLRSAQADDIGSPGCGEGLGSHSRSSMS
jgi:hypothetical protein